jgi:hypothetical protein
MSSPSAWDEAASGEIMGHARLLNNLPHAIFRKQRLWAAGFRAPAHDKLPFASIYRHPARCTVQVDGLSLYNSILASLPELSSS